MLNLNIMEKKFVVFMICALCCFVISCHDKKETESVGLSNVYRKALPVFPTIDPKYSTSSWNYAILAMFAEPLFTFDSDLKLKSALLEEWKLDDTKTIYSFKLKDDIYFHDGSKLTSHDVKFSISRLLIKNTEYAESFLFIKGAADYMHGKSVDLEGIRIINDREFTIELNEPFYFMLSLLASPKVSIFPEFEDGILETDFFKKPVGTGPFKIESIIDDKQIVLLRNNLYHGPSPLLEKIEISFLDKDIAIEKFKRGELEDIDSYRIDQPLGGDYNLIVKQLPNTNLLLVNSNKQPFNDLNFRQAIFYGLDKEKLSKICSSHSIGAYGVIPWGLGGYIENPFNHYDLEKAKEFLKKAGFPNGKGVPNLEILRPNYYSCKVAFADEFERQMLLLGLKAKVIHVPFNKIINSMKKFDYSLLNITFISDADEAYPIIFKTIKHVDFFEKDNELTAFLKKIIKTSNQYERYEIYKRINEIIIGKVPVIPLCYGTAESYYQPYVRGIDISPLSIAMNKMDGIWLSQGGN